VANQRWTDETEQLVVEAHRVLRAHPVLPEYEKTWARTVLTALADAGLLVEPGGESGPSFGQTPGWWPSEDPLLISDDAVEEATP
jgi:hypothetical protein